MSLLSESDYGQEWLKNFDLSDRKTASLLIDRLMLVGSSEFTSAIVKQLETISVKAGKDKEMIALFAEREVEKHNHEIMTFFPGSKSGRAVGAGIQPVKVDPQKQDVGSEGILAALITKFCKSYPNIAMSHPGPDSLRKSKVRKIVIVTDFIGSGGRLYEMLDAFAKVATLQSWRSYHLISFHVVCYSATEFGMKTLLHHPLRPKIHSHVACPVIDEAFEGADLGAVKLLCKRYPKKSKFPFGFMGTGSLIAFSHGIPNNAPQILHSSAKGWKPLFEGRSTFAADIDSIADSTDLIIKNSEKTLKTRNARKLLEDDESELWVHTMLVLYGVRRGLRTASKLSARTQIPLSSVEKVLNLACEAKWLTSKNSLTALGRRELKGLKWRDLPENVLALGKSNLYFPTQLRVS